MFSNRVTLRDVAERAGVSKTAVSLALRNNPRISQEQRNNILRVVKELKYEPDPLFQHLAIARHNHPAGKIHSAISWINRWEEPARLLSEHKEFSRYWKGAIEAACEKGYRIDEIQWPSDRASRRLEQILIARGIRGVLIPPHLWTPDWGDFNWKNFSIVRFGASVKSPDVNVVTSDQYRATAFAINTIQAHGYGRIGIVIGKQLDRRLDGVYQSGFGWAQSILNLQPKLPSLGVDASDYGPHMKRVQRSLLHWINRYKPDAVFTTEVYLPRLLMDLGLRIPEDIAVAGASIDVPVDAGIDQNSEAIGRIAVEQLLRQIHCNERGIPAVPGYTMVESLWREGKSLPVLRV